MIAHRVALLAGVAGLLIALCGAPALAQAPDPAQIKAARMMMAASGADRGFDQMIPQFLEETRRMFVQTRPDVDKQTAETLQQLAPEFNKRKDEVLAEVAGFYARRFSKEELDQITAFYTSPAGKKMTELLPGVTAETRQYLDTWTRTLGTDIVTRLRAELKKKGIEI